MPGLCSRIEPETFCSSLLILTENTRTRELKAMLYWAYESWSQREIGGQGVWGVWGRETKERKWSWENDAATTKPFWVWKEMIQ